MLRHRAIALSLVALAATMVAVQPSPTPAVAQSASPAADKPYAVEYYYKAKWGSADEFLTLFKKNHLPVLRKEMEMGRIVQVTMVKPRYHATEDGRWDYRVTIVWKNVSISQDDFDPQTITKVLYPDQATFKQEEQRRFAILEAHWDLPIADVELPK